MLVVLLRHSIVDQHNEYNQILKHHSIVWPFFGDKNFKISQALCSLSKEDGVLHLQLNHYLPLSLDFGYSEDELHKVIEMLFANITEFLMNWKHLFRLFQGALLDVIDIFTNPLLLLLLLG